MVLIPDSQSDGWISTDPKQHVRIWSQANQAHGGDLVPLIKMLKAWNKLHSALFRSFHLELIVLNVLNGVTISDFPSGLRYVFDKARDLIEYQISDPAGYGDDVGRYLDTREKIKAAVNRLDAACERALAAERFAAEGKMKSAYQKWGALFGGYFPTYG